MPHGPSEILMLRAHRLSLRTATNLIDQKVDISRLQTAEGGSIRLLRQPTWRMSSRDPIGLASRNRRLEKGTARKTRILAEWHGRNE